MIAFFLSVLEGLEDARADDWLDGIALVILLGFAYVALQLIHMPA